MQGREVELIEREEWVIAIMQSMGCRDAAKREQDAKLKRLHEACRLGRIDEVNTLLGDGLAKEGVDEKEEVKIDVDARDPGSGWTAMHFTCLRGNLQVDVWDLRCM